MQGGTKITPEVVQSVRDAIDIVEVAGDMTRLVKKGGSKYEGLCPFHKEKTPSFSVDSDKGLFYCFGCGAGGDAIKLYMQHHGDDFPAAIEALASRYGIALSMAPPSAAQRRQRQLGTALEAASEFFRHRLLQAGEARRYLQRRQISSELQERFALGYAPEGWHFLLDALGARFPVEDLEEAGLVGISRKDPSRPRPYDRFRHRLMFPIHNPTGRLVGFGGRTLGDDKAKYINTSETEQFKKGHFLYGFHLAKRAMRDAGKVLLVEGYFDVLGAAACGIDWVVAGMGTALTADQARLMARYTDEVVLAYDGDAAGQKAVQRSLPILLAAGLGVRRARFPAGHDPDSLRLEEGPEVVLEIVRGATDAVQEEIERLTPLEIQKDPREKTRAASAIAEILKPIRDSIIKHSYGQMAAERLGVPVEMLWRRVGGGSKPSPSPEPKAPSRSGLVRSTEEKAIQLLLAEGAQVPDLSDLPFPEVFLDEDCRNIFEAFYALYSSDGSRVPATQDVISRLNWEEGSVDKAARLLVQVPDSGEGTLAETLNTLRYRWIKQRQVDLMRQIKQAQLQNDQARLAQLLEEKKNLNQSLHPAMTGKFW